MKTAADKAGIIRGCSFLVEDHPLDRIFIPEEFTEDELMIGKLAWDFVEGSVQPKLEALEAREPGVAQALIREAGELGLVGVDLAASEEMASVDELRLHRQVEGRY